jgi:mono/diheme cytochrome c family protein
MLKALTTVGAIAIAGSAFAAGGGAGDAERGAYLARIMDCQGCHSGCTPEGALDPAQNLTGGTIGFELPGLGIFWPPNLTPSPEALGGWTDKEIAAALRTGVRPDGRLLAPIMPWPSYAVLTDEDAADLIAYLRTLPPSANRMPAPMPAGADAPASFFRVVLPAAPPTK